MAGTTHAPEGRSSLGSPIRREFLRALRNYAAPLGAFTLIAWGVALLIVSPETPEDDRAMLAVFVATLIVALGGCTAFVRVAVRLIRQAVPRAQPALGRAVEVSPPAGERRAVEVSPLADGDVEAVVDLAHCVGFAWEAPAVRILPGSETIQLVATADGERVGYLRAWGGDEGVRLTRFLVDPHLPFNHVADPLLAALLYRIGERACLAVVLERDLVRRRLLARHGFVRSDEDVPRSWLLAAHPESKRDEAKALPVIGAVRRV